MAAVGRSGDVRAIRVAVRAGRPMTMAGGVILLLGIIFGFATAAKMQIPLNTPWLMASIVMALLILIAGLFVFAPWLNRLMSAAAASPDDPPSAELLTVARARLPGIAGPITGLLWLGLLYAMVFKP